MQKEHEQLLAELEGDLAAIRNEERATIRIAERSVHVIKHAMERLRSYVIEHPFSKAEEEIAFFKEVKPSLFGKLIYYLKLYRLERRKPMGSRASERKYLKKELQKLGYFFYKYAEFYDYWRSGACYMDEQFFRRGRYNIQLLADATYFVADPSFCTSHDNILSRIMANELLSTYLNTTLEGLKKKATAPATSMVNSTAKAPMHWTAPKSALIELVYALHSCGVYNNGQVDVKDIALHFEQTNHVELGNFYRTFQQLRIRKKSRTDFIDGLKKRLEDRMDDSDENPRF